MKSRGLIVLLGACALSASAQQGSQGEWEAPFNFGPSVADRIRAVDLIHVFDGFGGKFLALTEDDPPAGTVPFHGGVLARLWTPPAMGSTPGDPGVFEAVEFDPHVLFCGGHSTLADGRVLHVGGGESANPFFEAEMFYPDVPPSAASWNNPAQPPPMNRQRWYPTCTTLPDGDILVSGGVVTGVGHERRPERYHPSTTATPPFDDWWEELPVTAERAFNQTYPYMFVLPDGRVVDASPRGSAILDLATATWGSPIPKPTWPIPLPDEPRGRSSAVMYEPGKIMVCGGSIRDPAAPPPPAPADQIAIDTTWVLDLNNNSAWLNAAPMNRKRRNNNLVVMPDGKILCVGGNGRNNTQEPVYEAEIFDPAASGNAAWTLQPPLAVGHERWYHSTAILLQDGRVVAAGGNHRPTAQIFRPPYITSGAPRPIITDAPLYMEWGEEYTILYSKNEGPAVTQACLIRLGSVTHGFDSDARRVPLTITASTDGPQPSVTIAAPDDGAIAPPGYYMLWILNEYANNQFAPCELAAYVQVGP